MDLGEDQSRLLAPLGTSCGRSGAIIFNPTEPILIGLRTAAMGHESLDGHCRPRDLEKIGFHPREFAEARALASALAAVEGADQ